MMGTPSIKQRIGWQKARRVILAVYRATGTFPRHQLFSLTAPMQGLRRGAGAFPDEGLGYFKGDASLMSERDEVSRTLHRLIQKTLTGF